MLRHLHLLLLIPLAYPFSPPHEEPAPPYNYNERNIEGWTVLIQEELAAEQALCQRVQGLLRIRLWEIVTRLPAPVVERLRDVKLRLHLNRPGCQGGVYHPSPVWLREHDLPEDWGLGIEFGNAQNFLSWSRQQPAMVLHELSHAWHHQVLGYGREDVLESFEATRESGVLEEVLYVSGGTRRAYGLNNPQEFFAEMSEAWWATNDFYPFVRGEVRDRFPGVEQLMEACWQLPEK